MKRHKELTIRERQGRKSREKGDTNRGIVFLTILEKPRSFSELLRETPLKSSKSLSDHLKKLEENNVIEKAIKDGRTVYKLKIFDSAKIVEELEKDLFSAFLVSSIVEKIFENLLPNSYKEIHEAIQKSLTNIALSMIERGKEAGEKQPEKLQPIELDWKDIRLKEGKS